MRTYQRKNVWIALVVLSPSVCFALDTVGAIPVVCGWLAALLLIAGLIGMLISRFGFKSKGAVSLILFLPGLALAGLTAVMFSGPRAKSFHRGPTLQSEATCFVTVSDKFGEIELAKLYTTIESGRFKTEVSPYTRAEVSNYLFAVDLVYPANHEAKHFVVLYTQPQVSEDEPDYNGMRYELSKLVLETDPIPSDTPVPQPSKIN